MMNSQQILSQLKDVYNGEIKPVGIENAQYIYSWELPVFHSMIKVDGVTGQVYTLIDDSWSEDCWKIKL